MEILYHCVGVFNELVLGHVVYLLRFFQQVSQEVLKREVCVREVVALGVDIIILWKWFLRVLRLS